MSVGEELQHTLRSIGFVQLLLLLIFMAGYALSLGRFAEGRSRRRAALLALAAAIAFCVLTSPWVHGVLLMALAVGGMGLFIAIVAGISGMLGLSQSRLVPQTQDSGLNDSVAGPTTVSLRDEAGPRPAARRRVVRQVP